MSNLPSSSSSSSLSSLSASDFIIGGDDHPRLFFISTNSSSAVSSTYATLIILSISGFLGLILGAMYFSLFAASGSTDDFFGRKRTKRFANIPKNNDYSNSELIRLLNLIAKSIKQHQEMNSKRRNEDINFCQIQYQVCKYFNERTNDKNQIVSNKSNNKELEQLIDESRDLLMKEDDQNALNEKDFVKYQNLSEILRASLIGKHAQQRGLIDMCQRVFENGEKCST